MSVSVRILRAPVLQVGTRVIRAKGATPVVRRRSFALFNQTDTSTRYETILASRRWHSTPSDRHKQYDFDQIKELSAKSSEERLIIDVREPAEYEAGYIPGAVNIPVKSQPDAIFLAPEAFEDRFGFSKPSEEKELIFYCRAGVRSSAAAQLAQQQGYKHISEYRGSWLDWEKNGGPIARP